MASHSPKVDAYIEAAPDYAKPILQRLRKLFHQACPRIEETMKWSVPHFDYKGILAGVSAHKKHVNLVFWKSPLMQDPAGLFPSARGGAMNPVRLEQGAELPSDKVLLSYILDAVQLNEAGAKIPLGKRKSAKKELPVPDDLAAALEGAKQAKSAFEAFSPSHRREYIEWITGAKREETRAKRIAQALEWVTAGKSRNWKYERG
jgi:uncharacterized protein YdeI (YjbR/CyaY-like superfamily)